MTPPSITRLGKLLAPLPVRAGNSARHGALANQSSSVAVISP